MADNPPKVLLRSEESGGYLAVVELTGEGRPPLHRHDFDETFYVLEGELTFRLGGGVFTRSAGELAFAPRGVAHTYANLSGTPARALLMITPAGNAVCRLDRPRCARSPRDHDQLRNQHDARPTAHVA